MHNSAALSHSAREEVIRRYFQAWLKQDATLLENIFDPAVVYSESWGPQYHGYEKLQYWFSEWNSRAQVVQWDIKQFLHQGLVTAVEWQFRNQYDAGGEEYFDGVSLFEFDATGKVTHVKEFGSRLPHYDPYDANSFPPQTTSMWLTEK